MKRKALAGLTAAVLMLSGCGAEIDYSEVTLPARYTEAVPDPDGVRDIMQETVIIPQNMAYDTYSPRSFTLSEEEFEETSQIEFNTDREVYASGLEGFNGNGFISLTDREYASLTVNVPGSQHYDITVRMYGNGAKL